MITWPATFTYFLEIVQNIFWPFSVVHRVQWMEVIRRLKINSLENIKTVWQVNLRDMSIQQPGNSTRHNYSNLIRRSSQRKKPEFIFWFVWRPMDHLVKAPNWLIEIFISVIKILSQILNLAPNEFEQSHPSRWRRAPVCISHMWTQRSYVLHTGGLSWCTESQLEQCQLNAENYWQRKRATLFLLQLSNTSDQGVARWPNWPGITVTKPSSSI